MSERKEVKLFGTNRLLLLLLEIGFFGQLGTHDFLETDFRELVDVLPKLT
jgi:hypothetical protein